jgi:hypothetical protein
MYPQLQIQQLPPTIPPFKSLAQLDLQPSRHIYKVAMSGIRIIDCTPSFGSKNEYQPSRSTWNNVLRAHNLPLRKDGDCPVNLPPPLNFPIPEKLRVAGYDVEYFSRLPEFQHWNDPRYGKEAFLHDTDILNSKSAASMSLVDLFLRSPVDPSWYCTLPVAQHTERQGELERIIAGHRRRIRQINLINETLESDIALYESELTRCKARIERHQRAQQAMSDTVGS